MKLHKLLELSVKSRHTYLWALDGIIGTDTVAQLFPKEVKGIVMMDAGNPDYYASQDTIQGELSGNKLKAILQKTGIMRLLFKNENFINNAYASRNNFRLISPQMIEMDKALYLKNLTNKNKNDEIKHLYENAKIVTGASQLGNIPLRILTAEKPDADDKINTEWIKSQKDFMKWSQNSNMEIIKNGNHYFYQFAPQTAVDTILKIAENKEDEQRSFLDE